MSDIFVSYASADRERAKVVAEALAARGLSVWWDRNIPPGRQFDEVIEEALDAARCVVVLWSQTSTASTWVKTEAAEAMRGKALVPAIIEEGVRIPLEFRRLQAADLSRWKGDPSDPQLLHFFESVEAELKRSGGGGATPVEKEEPPPVDRPKRIEPAPPPPPPAPPVRPMDRAGSQPKSGLSPAVIGIIVAVVVVLIGAGVYYERGRSIAAAEQAARDKVAAEQAEREREQAARAAAQRKAEEEQKARAAQRPGPATAPQRPGAAQSQGVPAAGTVNLKWRDSALGFTGALTWNPSSALIRAAVTDLRTGTLIGNYAVPAVINQQGPTDYVVSADFSVPGDSTTPGPHTHTSRLLVRAQQDGSLRFLQNCPRPGECY